MTRATVMLAALALDMALVVALTLLGVNHVLPAETIAVLLTGLIAAHARRFGGPRAGGPELLVPGEPRSPLRELRALSGAAAMAAMPVDLALAGAARASAHVHVIGRLYAPIERAKAAG